MKAQAEAKLRQGYEKKTKRRCELCAKRKDHLCGIGRFPVAMYGSCDLFKKIKEPFYGKE